MSRPHADRSGTTALGDPATARRGRLVDGLVVALSLIVVLAGFEIFLRIDDRRPAAEYAEITLGPHACQLFDDPAKLADVSAAIVVLGDSFTAGSACGRTGNHPARFGELAGASGLAHDVISLATIDTNLEADPLHWR